MKPVNAKRNRFIKLDRDGKGSTLGEQLDVCVRQLKDQFNVNDMRVAVREAQLCAVLRDDPDAAGMLSMHAIFWDGLGDGIDPVDLFLDTIDDYIIVDVAICLRECLQYMLKELNSYTFYTDLINQYVAFWDQLYILERSSVTAGS
nr:hypothetical protein [uncultured Chitinophaga sp.]